MTLTLTGINGDLWLPTVEVSGNISDTSAAVWVNGVRGTNNGDGTWNAVHVPLPEGGTAVIQARAIPNSNNGGNGTGGSGGGPVSYDNLGNPDPPQDNDTEAGTADQPTEVVLDSAHWTFDSTENLLHENAMNNDHETYHEEGNYTHQGGGSVTEVGKVTDTNGVTTTGTTTFTLAPDQTTTEIETVDASGWSDYTYNYASDGTITGVHLSDSSGVDFDYSGSLDNIGIAQEEGSLSWQSPITANYNWKKSSTVKMTLNTGGHGKISNLFQLTAAATEQKTTPPYFQGIPSQQITVAGKSLDENAIAYATFQDGTSVDVTPQTSAAYYSFTVGAGKYHCYFEVFVDQPNPGYSFLPIGNGIFGHAYYRLSTDAPSDALQYISSGLTTYLGETCGFFPGPSGSICSSNPGQLEFNDANGSANVYRKFYIGFNNLIDGLEYTRGLDKAPPPYCWSGYQNCVGAVRDTGFSAGVALPWDQSPQNFGVTLVRMYPGPFWDGIDIFPK